MKVQRASILYPKLPVFIRFILFAIRFLILFFVNFNILETEIRYNDALQDIEHKEKKYKQLCGKIKQKEETYEYKVQELNLKLEQDKYINQLLSNRANKTCKK